MFGKPQQSNGTTPSARPAAGDVAKIQGGGLVQIIVTNPTLPEFYVFLNEQYIPQMEIEGFSVNIEAPDGSGGGTPVVRATLSRLVATVTGGRSSQRQELFPSTLELIALGRRIAITCSNLNSLEGLWINLGLQPDGNSAELKGVKALSIVLEGGILDAKLTWTDGVTENLLPSAS